MHRYDIRRLGRDDAMHFKDIRLDGLLRHPEAFGASFEEEQDQSEAQFAERIENNIVFGGSSEGGTLAGVIAVSRWPAVKTRHIASIWGMYVRPTERGTGLSRLLITAAVDEIGTTCRSIRLSVVSSNIPAIRLYKSMGFEAWATDVEALKVGNTYHDEILMRLETGA